MPVITFRDVINKGKCFFNKRIQKDTTLEKTLEIYACIITEIEKAIDLDSIHLRKLGIYDTCKLKYKNLLSEILNILILSDENLNSTLVTINKAIANFTTSISNVKDEKVKTRTEDPTAGFLIDKITSPQTGCISVVNEKISIVGFCPIGTVVYIDAGRIGDFDGTGKGKSGTDVWTWALANGNNGTRNRFGKFPRYVSANSDAGNTGGSDEVTVETKHIPSLTFPVNGSISNALGSTTFPMKFDTNKMSDGSGGSVFLLRLTIADGAQTMNSQPIDLTHSHGFNLNGKFENPAPTNLPIIPQYIYELPIQRINA